MRNARPALSLLRQRLHSFNDQKRRWYHLYPRKNRNSLGRSLDDIEQDTGLEYLERGATKPGVVDYLSMIAVSLRQKQHKDIIHGWLTPLWSTTQPNRPARDHAFIYLDP
jgi:hypothetical protein